MADEFLKAERERLLCAYEDDLEWILNDDDLECTWNDDDWEFAWLALLV